MDDRQVAKAATALLKYVERQQEKKNESEKKKSLFVDSEFVYLSLTLMKMPDKGRVNGWRIAVPHSLYAGTDICLITKDPVEEWEEKLEAKPVDEIKKLIDLSTLRKNYAQYKDKRDLFVSYDVFFADERILKLLPHLIGKRFFEGNKQPIPVRLSGKNIDKSIAAARDATYFFMRGGNICGMKVGKTDFSPEELTSNILEIMPNVIKRIPGGWKNVQAVHLRTGKSPALPIYKCLPVGPMI
ncbi:hypothetical protein AAMO2058_000954700 [Amorphochlora amoebiformis]